MSPRLIGVIVAAVGLVAAACGSPGTSSSGPVLSHHTVSHSRASRPLAAPVHRTIGAGCARFPAKGPRSIISMAALPAATAAAHNPQLVQLTRFIKAAGMTSMLNSAKEITIFAPDNAAFVALGQGNLTTLLASKSDLTKVLGYQVVIGRHSPADFASRKHLTTLQGTVVLPAHPGRHWYIVNNADVVCGNIQTANATLYIVDRVLVPLR